VQRPAISRTPRQSEPVALSVAKACCSDAAREVGARGAQVHGGIGFTWEHNLRLYYKRAKASEIMFGDANYHREEIARKVVDGDEDRKILWNCSAA
jgi:alkylation response protein AidB-like acyl-CoA dehydrogenase